MIHTVDKINLFNFLKAESIIIEVNTRDNIEIIEDKNIGTSNLQKVILTTLNPQSKYWKLNPETSTFLQPNSKKVESIIIEQTDNNILNIFLIEMKSKQISRKTVNEIEEKFTISLSWVYVLLNLLNHKEEQSIKVFGILVAQKNMNWNSRETLNILSSTSIRYKKKSFYTPNIEIDIPIKDLIL